MDGDIVGQSATDFASYSWLSWSLILAFVGCEGRVHGGRVVLTTVAAPGHGQCRQNMPRAGAAAARGLTHNAGSADDASACPPRLI